MRTGDSRQIIETPYNSTYLVGHDKNSAGELILAFNMGGVGNQSRLYVYNSDLSQSKILDFNFRIVSAPRFSPDGKTIGFNNEVQSGQLSVPSTFNTVFVDRAGTVLIGLPMVAWRSFPAKALLCIPRLLLLAPSPANLFPTPKTLWAFHPAQTASASPSLPGQAMRWPMSSWSTATVRAAARSPILKSGERSVVFSPEGDSLLVPTVEGCNDLISFGRAPDLVHMVPADAALADVTQETQSTFCACAAQIKTGLHWHLEPIT